ncbi:hypothetical protein CFP56_038570 [Quercus suber]|uniref:Uncharacterized protein n=1 Tax=Quercus suber TaxID=58331 RepID=A0AAW0LMT8_QUESU
MLHFLEVAEVGSQLVKKYEHFDLTLQKVHVELQVIRNVDDLASALQDPLYVPSKRRPKYLRPKNPKENEPTKKRKWSICKETSHVRSTCPSTSSVHIQDLPSWVGLLTWVSFGRGLVDFSIGFAAMGNGFANWRGGVVRWRLVWRVSRIGKISDGRFLGFGIVVVVGENGSFFLFLVVVVVGGGFWWLFLVFVIAGGGFSGL